jgi:antitoxin CptB
MENDVPTQAQVRWQCRRGMLELDLILFPFVDNVFSDLSLADRQNFIKLLSYPDQDLVEWLMGRGQVADSALQAIVDQIRESAWKV